MVYIFSLLESGYENPHSLIRETFNSPVNKVASLLAGDLLFVLSSVPPVGSKPLSQISMDNNPDGDVVFLRTRVCFDNRGRENRIPKRLGPLMALKKFEEMSGLVAMDDKVQINFEGALTEKKFNIHNAFRIEGEFRVQDKALFRNASENGVGSRKSYGFGMLFFNNN